MKKFTTTTLRTSPLVAALAFVVLASGCGKLEFNLTDLRPPSIPIQKASADGVEVVSGASVGKKTLLNQYTVDASVGAVRDRLETTTPNGYRIFHGVKGAIVSEQ